MKKWPVSSLAILVGLLFLFFLSKMLYWDEVATSDGGSYEVVTADGDSYEVTVRGDLPSGCDLVVSDVDSKPYADVLNLPAVTYMKFLDISLLKDGYEIEPDGEVEVDIKLTREEREGEVGRIYHFVPTSIWSSTQVSSTQLSSGDRSKADVEPPDGLVSILPDEVPLGSGPSLVKTSLTIPVADGTDLSKANTVYEDQRIAADDVEVVELASFSGNSISFKTSSFSVFGVIYTIQTRVLTADGQTYSVSVSYESGIPEGAELEVSEITEGEAYDDYVARAETALGIEKAEYIRLFDIAITKDGEKIQPDGTVSVKIELADSEADDLSVVHFDGESGNVGSVVECTTEGQAVSFDTDGFSVYAIVDAPEPTSVYQSVNSLDDIETGQEYYLSIGRSGTNYMTSASVLNSSTYELKGDTNMTSGEKWLFEFPEEGKVSIYYFDSEGTKKYLNVDGSRNITFSETAQALLIEPTINAPGTFYIYTVIGNKNYALSVRSSRNFFFENRNNGANANERVVLTKCVKDPYSLDGQTYGIAYHDDSATAAAMTAESTTVSNQSRLLGLDMFMRPDVLTNDGILLVAADSNIQEWTFHCVEENKYHLSTIVDGATKYLKINNNNVTLVDNESAASIITATPGSGTYSGKWHFSVNGYSLNLADATKIGFNAITRSDATTWMNLVEKSVLPEDAFIYYSAKKVSVSDTTNVHSGQKVIIYTRIWNDTTKKYEFYAVDHNGTLIRCYDTGDNIEWIGSRINTAMWEFQEYFENGSPSYYYELQNTQYGNYIRPNASDDTVFSDEPLGINLNGRRYGESYTEIISWDDESYSYSGLKTENGHVVACPLSEAEDFYFAVINPVEDQLTTVDTIDNSQYGITMKMIDFNNPITGTGGNARDSVQHAFFGSHGYVPRDNDEGLLSTNLDADGYPLTTAHAGNPQSLSNLFSDLTDVNHLFIKSIYNESGYFEYDSTQNFASLLNDEGYLTQTFTVYDQLAAIGTDTGVTRTHGQFMPYNKITAGNYAYDSSGNLITNQTSVIAQPLDDVNPRKGEVLYNIPSNQADYYFGMEMSASFTQPADGLDAWNHDIIFEFSGDDDFWLYVDGELVLDLGGVHSAMTGSINFRTGKVKNEGKVKIFSSSSESDYAEKDTFTLKELFASNYWQRGMNEAEINAKLNEIFEAKTVDDKTVYTFKDYTTHTMKMFYMERGAGASNLHMRFNLAAVKPGTIELSKKLSGTESESNSLIEFPYQIYYRTSTDESYQLLTEQTNGVQNVTHKADGTPVTYKESLIIEGSTYSNVFMLKPGQNAVIDLPDDTVDYYIVECGVNGKAYDVVKANGEELTGRQDLYPQGTEGGVTGSGRNNFPTTTASMEARPQVVYDNHVSDGAMRNLLIGKILYDTDGETVLGYDNEGDANETLFEFRLYLGNEYEEDVSLANLYPYYVKNSSGQYCYWDNDAFRPIVANNQPITTYENLKTYLNGLTSTQRESIVFRTSTNGTISNIPAGYTVEVRDLIIGTQYKVEERDEQIPRGYTRRESDGYTRMDGSSEAPQSTPYTSTMQANETPRIEVRNQKGWGLTVEKVWTDADFMQSHDPIYFTVYIKETNNGDDTYTLYDGTVRQMLTTESEIYYFFHDLKYTIGDEEKTYDFSDFVIREVTISEGNPTVVNGVVQNPGTVTPIHGTTNERTLVIGGKPISGEYKNYEYTVTYHVGEITGHNENIRTDTVTNSRDGIKLVKTDLNGNPLAGAKFTLTDAEGNNVALESYTSQASDGLITIAYLDEGTYTLTEVQTPKGYISLDGSLTIIIDDEGSITLSGADNRFYTYSAATDTDMACITIKNRPVELQVKKVIAGTSTPLAGVHFALYRQVTDNDGNKVRDYLPMSGYTDLVTTDTGLLEEVNMQNLKAGTYYLHETETLQDYGLLTDDLCFTIGKDGRVKINSGGTDDWLSEVEDENTHKVTITIAVPNGKSKNVSIWKTDSEHGTITTGAQFELYWADDFDDVSNEPKEGADAVTTGITGQNGILNLGDLTTGDYRLIEKEAPDGFIALSVPIKITVGETSVTAMQGTNQAEVTTKGEQYWVEGQDDDTYQVRVWNNPGVELPATGGPTTTPIYLLGILLTTIAGLSLLLRRKVWL